MDVALPAVPRPPLRVPAAPGEKLVPGDDVLAVLRREVDPLGVARVETVAARDRRALLVEVFKAEERLLPGPASDRLSA